MTNATVTAISQTGIGYRVQAATHQWDARVVVNAAGGWAGEVAALAGLDVPVQHVRRAVFGSAEDLSLSGSQ